jgi:small subunit ribosomal protein S9
MSEITTASATGRRKNAIAHVWLSEGSGQIIINGRTFEEYLPTIPLQNTVLLPFQHGHLINKFDVKVVAKGGGIHGQVGAISLGISRALTQLDPEIRKLIKPHGLLTRDGRMKERKKAGRPGARKRFQFSKR